MAITPSGAGTFTTIHFVVLALLILATLALIATGMRRARARRAAERRVEEDTAEVAAAEPIAAPEALDRSPVAIAPPPPALWEVPRPGPVATDPPPEPAPLADERPAPLADERIAAAAPMDASPATIADPTPADVQPSPADGAVTQLKGLGPKVATRLAELGINSVGQLAALDADAAAAVDAQLGPFAGRLHRDRWVEQARFLAAGDRAGFEAVFGRL